jgi:hypothetical protein
MEAKHSPILLKFGEKILLRQQVKNIVICENVKAVIRKIQIISIAKSEAIVVRPGNAKSLVETRLSGRLHINSQILVAGARYANYMQIEIEPFPLVA